MNSEKKRSQKRNKEEFKKKQTTYNIVHIIKMIQSITKSKSTTNIPACHFKSALHILNTLPTYKYITSIQN